MKSIKLHPKHGLNPTISTCYFCGKEKNELVLLGNSYKEQAPKNLVINKEPCNTCKDYMNKGTLLISVKDNTDHDNPYRTGKLCVITKDAAKRILNIDSNVAFIEDSVWERIGLPE
jgi:hypothetical protein